MSLEARTALAAAANTVGGVKCSPYFQQSHRPGDAVVRLASTSASDDGFGRVATWQIWITLPQDRAQAEKWIDTHHDQLVAALDREFIAGVQTVLPAGLVFEPGAAEVNGLVIEGNREH